MITVRHIVEQILNEESPGKLQLEEIMWPFDDTLAVHLVIDPPQETDIEIRELGSGKVYLTVIRRDSQSLPQEDPVGTTCDIFDLHEEKDLLQFAEELVRVCEDFIIKMYVDGTKHA